MQFHSAPTIVVRNTRATEALWESLVFISSGGGQDQVGLRYWLRKQQMKITVTSHRYATTGEMQLYDETAPDNEILIDVLVEFASMDDANRFIVQWS